MKLSLAGIGVAALLVASAASADEPLFRKGRVVLDVLGADVPTNNQNATYVGYAGPLTLQSEHSDNGEGESRSTATTSAYGLEPSVDYFLTDHITLGGRVGVAWVEEHAYSQQATGPQHFHSHGLNGELAPRVGYAIPIVSSLGFWPRLSGGLLEEYLWTSGAPTHTTGAYVQGNFALLARISPHVLLELGPVITYRTEQGAVDSADVGNLHTQLELQARSAFRVDF